jgi:ParB/RepB/Spo0J family partition protein
MTALDDRVFRAVSLELLDRPDLDARLDRDPDFLDALVGDIGRRGVLVPFIVVAVGDRYEIVDGYTRYIACRRLNLATVPCCVYPTKELALEGVKYAATAFHEHFSAADEAIYFKQLLETECEGDAERVAVLVNKKLGYVLDRLDLVNGDEEVFNALRRKAISIGVATELNKLPAEDWRRYYLTFAIKEGATRSVVVGWLTEWRRNHEGVPAAPVVEESGPAAPPVRLFEGHRCYVCRKIDARRVPQMVPIHTECLVAILDELLASYRGEQAVGE